MLTLQEQWALAPGDDVVIVDDLGPHRGFVLRRDSRRCVIDFEDGNCYAVPLDDPRLALDTDADQPWTLGNGLVLVGAIVLGLVLRRVFTGGS